MMASGATTSYVWDEAGKLPTVIDDKNQYVHNQYVYGAGLAEDVNGSNTYYFLPDALSSTLALIDSSGNLAGSYTYDPCGNVTGGSGSQPTNFQFAGQETDPTGMQYLRALICHYSNCMSDHDSPRLQWLTDRRRVTLRGWFGGNPRPPSRNRRRSTRRGPQTKPDPQG